MTQTLSLTRCAIAIALSIASFSAHAQSLSAETSAPAPRGPFGVSADQNIAWRIDQTTGAISYCIRDTNSNDAALIAQRPPICSAWSR